MRFSEIEAADEAAELAPAATEPLIGCEGPSNRGAIARWGEPAAAAAGEGGPAEAAAFGFA